MSCTFQEIVFERYNLTLSLYLVENIHNNEIFSLDCRLRERFLKNFNLPTKVNLIQAAK